MLDIIKLPPSFPTELRRPRQKFPGLGVRWASDLAGTSEVQSRYVLRWESLGSNRDRARTGPLPEPSMLTLHALATQQ